jgi:lysophospholipase L1-like esterase
MGGFLVKSVIALFFAVSCLTVTVRAAPLRLMAIGDSITHGVDGASPTFDATAGGYRPFLADRFTGGNIEWLGRVADGPANARFHEGWSGKTIRYIDNVVIDPAFDALGTVQPDVVLLMIGTNDSWHPEWAADPLTTRERMLINLRALLLHINARAPESRIVVSTITPMGFRDPVIDEARDVYNNGLPLLLQDLQGEGINCGLVNAGGRVPPELLPDLIHPSAPGYKMIADGFYDAFVLPATPEPAAAAWLLLSCIPIFSRWRR